MKNDTLPKTFLIVSSTDGIVSTSRAAHHRASKISRGINFCFGGGDIEKIIHVERVGKHLNVMPSGFGAGERVRRLLFHGVAIRAFDLLGLTFLNQTARILRLGLERHGAVILLLDGSVGVDTHLG